ncbi:hypothetical protein THAOC_00416 [Thalassiosira oceanica]|uniref:SPRY domain-containing protein n=1 Tax=Thalassiosira oceanica TaxID=159749 RepID=K3W4D2_THAOC|nr:hypothetical protein THAOC_00416 [Thalassiosira oceanica]|eukprot:EJK77734.1 hypothetical protein THAOC_00416 [Thalassiosira oceanica]
MADNDRAKRLKSSQDGDLSRLDSDLITQVASFVGTSRELLDLALTCKSFGWQQSGSALNWSLAEEVARQAVCSAQHDIEGVRITLPQYCRGRTTWLSVLHESEDPLKFDTLLGCGIEYENSSRNSVRMSQRGSSTAIASNYVMETGIHYAEYLVSYYSVIGVVRPMPNLDPARFSNETFSFFRWNYYDDFLAARTDGWGDGNVHVCLYYTNGGEVRWTNWDDVEDLGDWEGMESCETGDTIGMLLNLDEGTLTVYKNNRRLGVMQTGLSGSYCWHATCWYNNDFGGSSVTIRRANLPGHERPSLVVVGPRGLSQPRPDAHR